jgi:hypothetical protein
LKDGFMPTLDEDIQNQADLTPEELRLLERMRNDQSTANGASDRSRLDAIFKEAGFTPPSASAQEQGPIGRPADPAAALQRASYSPSTPALPELQAGQGIAMGPNGFATAGITPPTGPAPADFRGNLTAPTPEQAQEAAAIQKAQQDAERLSSDAAQQKAYVDATKDMMEYQHRTQKGEEGMQVFADIMRRRAIQPGGSMPAGAMEQLMKPQAKAFVPQTMTLPGGREMIEEWPNRWVPAPIPQTMTTGPIEASPVMGAGKQLGWAMRGAGGAIHPVTEKGAGDELTSSQKLAAYTVRLKALQARELAGQMTPEEMAATKAERQTIAEALSKLTEPKSQGAAAGAAPTAAEKQLTADQAKQFLKQAGGDRTKARKLAKDAGYSF